MLNEESSSEQSKPLPGQRRLRIRGTSQIVKIPSNELHRALRAVSLSASTDADRPHLKAVHFEASDELVLSATDGHWLSQWRCEPEELPAESSEMLVSLDDVLRLIPLLAIDSKVRNQATINFDAGVVDLTDGTVLPLSKVSAPHPPYDTLWPKTLPTGTPHFGFTASLLARAVKAFKAGAGEEVVVRAQLYGAEKPIVLNAEQLPEFLVLLMPAIVTPPGDVK